MDIKLYNSLSGKKEVFRPRKAGEASVYSCGPTVYDKAHIGNLRSFVTADILVRTLRSFPYTTRWVMNVTDVDDKTIAKARALPEYGKDPVRALEKLTRGYEELFLKDLDALLIERPAAIPRATEHIREMESLINKVYDAGYAYIKDGSVYFDVSAYAAANRYGLLASVDVDMARGQARENADEYDKEEARDFALWKSAREGEPAWTIRVGRETLSGRPGWHIECSAMSHTHLSYPFDIHTGGTDLRFPHHENEIAQSVAGYGKPPARFFLHNEHLLIEGKKMSKSEGNILTLGDISAKGFSPLSYRYWLLETDYRKRANFTFDSLKSAETARMKLAAAYRRAERRGKPAGDAGEHPLFHEFLSSLYDDLNTPRALAALWKMARLPEDDADRAPLLSAADEILRIGISSAREKRVRTPLRVRILSWRRDVQRKKKNWEKADMLRKKIRALGYDVADERDGTRIFPSPRGEE